MRRNKTRRKIKYGGNSNTKRKGKNHNEANKLNKSEKFVKLNCSPENKNLNSYTCYSQEDLYKLRDVWNARHPDRKIKTEDTKEIWKTIKEYYKDSCNKESCWIEKIADGTKLEKELIDSFAPESPDVWKKKS